MAVNSAGRKTLRERVRVLELRVSELDRRLNTPMLAPAPIDEDDNLHFSFQPIIKRRGRPPRVEMENLIVIRDKLIEFLEINWPNLEMIFQQGSRVKPALRIAWFERAIYAVGKNFGVPESHYTFVREHLVKPKVVYALCEFVRDRKRYHGDPRSIANALAGADKLRWRTSLDNCEKIPYRVTILAPAIPAYIRRTYKRLYPTLFERPLAKQTIAKLKHSEDDYLWICKQGAAEIDELMALGMPDSDLLRTLGIPHNTSRRPIGGDRISKRI